MVMPKLISKEELKTRFVQVLNDDYSVTPDSASDKQVYEALSKVVVKLLSDKRKRFLNKTHSAGRKQVFYLSMEFLMGRSLKSSLYNLLFFLRASLK